MSKFVHPLTNFSSGELSENLFGRVDIREYSSGLSVTKNCLINPQGGAYKRIGSKFGPSMGAVLGNTVKLLSFVLESGDSIVIEISDNGLVLRDANLNFLGFSYASPSAIFPFGLDKEGFSGATFQDKIILTHYSGTMVPRIFDMSNLGNIVISNYPIDRFTSVPFLDPNIDESKVMQITNANTQGPYTLNANFSAFEASHVGSQIMVTGLTYASESARIASSTFLITAYSSATSVTVTPYHTYRFGCPLADVAGFPPVGNPLTAQFSEWSFSAWSDVAGYPKLVSTFEGRLIFGNTATKPNSMYASRLNEMFIFQDDRFPTADRTEFVYAVSGTDGTPFTANIIERIYNGPILVTDPYQFTIASKDGAGITFFEQSRFGAIGTFTSQFLMDGDGSVISQLNVSVRQFSSKSSYPNLSVGLDNTVFYVDSTRTRIFMYLYNDTNGSYISQEVSLLYGKFSLDDRIVSMVYSREFSSIICITEQGNGVSLTYNQETKTLGFSKFYTATATTKLRQYAAVTTDNYEDMGVGILEVGNDYRYVYFKRNTFNIGLPYELFIRTDELDYLDKFNLLLGYNSNTLSAMEQYQGDDLIIYGILPSTGILEKLEYPNYDGTSVLTLPNVYEDIAFGTHIEFIIATMPLEAGINVGTAQLGIKRIDKALIRSAYCDSIEVATDGYNYEKTAVKDGRSVLSVTGSPEYDHRVFIRHAEPGPCMINNMTLRGVSNDG